MALEKLVNIQGSLASSLGEIDPATWQHSAEITKQRITDTSLRNKWFWTADSALYRVVDGEIELDFAGRDQNLILQNIETATTQLVQSQNYTPNKAGIDAVVASPATLKIKVSDLKLTRHDNEFKYFEIDPTKYDSLNTAQRQLAERIYGQGTDFDAAMKMFSSPEVGIKKVRVYVLNPEYVKKHVKADGAIVRACRLLDFDGNSIFFADDRYVGDRNGHLRGVRLVRAAEGGELQKTPVTIYTPQEILAYLDKNPVNDPSFAAGLLNAVNTFYNPRK